MSRIDKHAANVLMTCALDEGVGGVQLVFRDLRQWLEKNGRRTYSIYPSPLPRLSLVEKLDSGGRAAFYCPMPAIVKDNALLSVPIFLAYAPLVFFHLARLIHRKKIDVINCHYLTPYFIHLVIAARLLRVPVMVSVHGADVDSYAESGAAGKLLYRLVMRGAHRIVACSESLARRTSEVFPEARGKITYVHNGLDCSRYPTLAPSHSLPRPFLLCVCRHVRKKGVDTLLRAFALIHGEFPTISLVLVGDGPLLKEHKALARTLAIDDRVVFAGNVVHTDVPAFLDGCTIFVLPSRDEPFGLVLLEAAYYRKPIVCTRVGGVPEIIADGINGVLVEPDDPARMAAGIRDLLRNPDVARELGLHARQTLMSRFLWEHRVLDYIAVYEESLGPSRQISRPSLA